MPVDDPGRLLIWPTISPRGHRLPRPAYYLTWPGWERHRVSFLSESPVYEGFSLIFIDEPANFAESLAQLEEATLDDGIKSFRTPFFETDYLEIKAAILSGESAPKPSGGVTPNWISPYLLVALWSTSESTHLEAKVLLDKALASRREMLTTMRGEDAPSLSDCAISGGLSSSLGQAKPSDSEIPPPSIVSASLALAWLELAKPILKQGDLLWSPRGFDDQE